MKEYEKSVLKEYSQFLLGTQFLQNVNPDKLIDDFINKLDKKVDDSRHLLVQHLIHALENMPEIISQRQIEFLDKSQQLTDIEARKKAMEEIAFMQVTDEVNDSGKPIFSNDGKRKAETNRRLEQDLTYADLVKQSLELTKEVKELDIKIQFLRRQNTNNNTKANLLSTWGD